MASSFLYGRGQFKLESIGVLQHYLVAGPDEDSGDPHTCPRTE
jgi:hypothetical protein